MLRGCKDDHQQTPRPLHIHAQHTYTHALFASWNRTLLLWCPNPLLLLPSKQPPSVPGHAMQCQVLALWTRNILPRYGHTHLEHLAQHSCRGRVLHLPHDVRYLMLQQRAAGPKRLPQHSDCCLSALVAQRKQRTVPLQACTGAEQARQDDTRVSGCCCAEKHTSHAQTYTTTAQHGKHMDSSNCGSPHERAQ